jgi:hypothetical protein
LVAATFFLTGLDAGFLAAAGLATAFALADDEVVFVVAIRFKGYH